MISRDYYSVVKDLGAQLRGSNINFKGEMLTDRDQLLVRRAICIQSLLIFDLLPSSMQTDSFRALRGAIPDNLDVSRIHETISDIDGVIKHYPEDFCHDVKMTYIDFKRSVKRNNGLMWLISPMKWIFEDFFECPSVRTFRILNTWTNCLGRLNLLDVNFDADEWNEYKCDEDILHSLTYDPSLIKQLNGVICSWFSQVSFDDFRPSHGPGTTYEAENRRSATIPFKYCHMKTDRSLVYLSKYIGDVNSYFWNGPPEHLERCSRLILVPKKIGKRRAISAEPTSLQFFQQGFRRVWYDYFRSHPYLRRHIHLEDNERSQQLASEGSILGDFATIDLSKASDFITNDLVKQLFKSTPWIGPLICTRSRFTEFLGERIDLAKFAPMGSALCFPVETTIFAACTELACRRKFGLNHHCRYEIYGDDLVVPSSIVEHLVVILEDLHFLVNHSKSFTTPCLINFREACGGEFLNGQDVRPFRIPRFFRGCVGLDNRNRASQYSAMISTINRAESFGLLYVRKYLMCILASELGHKVVKLTPRTRDGHIGLLTQVQYCTNFQLKSRFMVTNVRRHCYQRSEYFSIQVVAKSERNGFGPDDMQCIDAIAYHDWLIRRGYNTGLLLGCSNIDIVSQSDTMTKYQDRMFPTSSQLTTRWVYLD